MLEPERAPGTPLKTTSSKIPGRLLQSEQLSEHLDEWLDRCRKNLWMWSVRRFGLRGHDIFTLEEVGRQIGLTRERVRQIQVDALKELKSMLLEEGFSRDAVLS